MLLSSRARVSVARGAWVGGGKRHSTAWGVSAHTVASLVILVMRKVGTDHDGERRQVRKL